MGPLSIGLLVKDVARAVEALRARGIRIHREPYFPVPNERAAMVIGPDGEEIVLVEQTVR